MIQDGTAVWFCQRKPTVGDVFYAEADIETSGLTTGKGGGIRLYLDLLDTTNTLKSSCSTGHTDISGTSGLPARILPGSMRLRTPNITMTSGYTLRYLRAGISGYGEAGASFNLDVFRVNIIRVV